MAAIITPGEQSGGASWPMRKLLAYSGRYRIEAGNRFVTDVDIAWAPTWVGSSQGRNFSLGAGTLDIVSDPAPIDFLGGAVAIGVLSWVREDGGPPGGAHPLDLGVDI